MVQNSQNYRLLRVREAANLLGVPVSTVYFWLRTGRLQAAPIPGVVTRIPEATIKALVDAALPGGAQPEGDA